MKKNFILLGSLCCILILSSWSINIHRTISIITTNHLTARTQLAIQEILGDQSLLEAAWQDGLEKFPVQKDHGAWYRQDMPEGLTFERFSEMMQDKKAGRLYQFILRLKTELQAPGTSKEKKAEDLKLLVHFIGDLHQPFRVAKMKGKEKKISFGKRFFSIEEVCDGVIIDTGKAFAVALAGELDHVTAAQAEIWQQDPLMTWMWESYQQASNIYRNPALSDTLSGTTQQFYMPILKKRILQAGIRTAGILNEIFDQDNTDRDKSRASNVSNAALLSAIAQKATICDQVADVEIGTDTAAFVVIVLGAKHPNHQATVIIPAAQRKHFTKTLSSLLHKKVCVTGRLSMVAGRRQLVIRDPNQIMIQ